MRLRPYHFRLKLLDTWIPALLDTIRGTKQPSAMRIDEWDQWHRTAKAAHPVRYWIADTGYNFIVKCLNIIPNAYYAISFYIECRFFRKTHALTSNSLKKGQWHDYSDRALHCLFDEFCNFLEKDARLDFDSIGYLQYNTEELGYDPHDPAYLEPNTNKDSIKTVIELYEWWGNTRKNRKSSRELAGSQELHDRIDKKYGDFSFLPSMMDKKDRDEMDTMIKRMVEIENQYRQEDDEMLTKLVKVRRMISV